MKSSKKSTNPSAAEREKLSAWIDGEQSLNEDELLQLLEDELLHDDLNDFQLISDCFKSGIDRAAATIVPLPPATVKYSQWLARAALWFLVPGIVLFLWLKDSNLDGSHDAVGAGTLVADKSGPPQQKQNQPAPVTLTAANSVDGIAEDADFRMDYIIYHSAYLSSNKDHSAVSPYVRLASYPRER